MKERKEKKVKNLYQEIDKKLSTRYLTKKETLDIINELSEFTPNKLKKEQKQELIEKYNSTPLILSKEQENIEKSLLVSLYRTPQGHLKKKIELSPTQVSIIKNMKMIRGAGLYKVTNMFGETITLKPVYEVIDHAGNSFKYYHDLGDSDIVVFKGVGHAGN